MLRKIIQPFYTAYALIVFAMGIIAIYPFNVLFSIGKNITARKRINALTRACFRFLLFIIGMPVKVIGEKQDGRYVFVANHSSYIDDIIIFSAIPGHFRPLGKKEMTKIPFWGYQYKHIVILIDRKNKDSRARSMRLMWRLLKREGSTLIFPEGTFNETGKPLKEFYDGAFRLAITAQTPIAPIVFPDAVRRAPYHTWWKFWPGKNRAICLEPVQVNGLTIDDLPMLKQSVYTLMENALIKYRAPESH